MKKFQTTVALMVLMCLICGAITSAPASLASSETPYAHAPQLHKLTVGSVPAQSQALDAVEPPLHALALSMLERDLAYDPSNPEFMWNSLYYMIGMYSELDWRYQDHGNTFAVPSELVEDITYALFGQYVPLPAIPASLEDFVSYSEKNDQYTLTKGDIGLMELQLSPLVSLGDGTYQVTGYFVGLEHEEVFCTIQGQLLENDSMFGYCIQDLSVKLVESYG